MNENYEIAFNLILHAGNSKSNSMLAIKAAKEARLNEVDAYLQQAEEELTKAHQLQTNLIQAEARGTSLALSLIMVHAQDHLMMALMTLDNAREFIELYRRLDQLELERLKTK